MYKHNRRAVLLGSAALAIASFGTRARAADETVTLYNGQHRATTEAVVAAFTQATGIKVTVRQGEKLAARQPDHGRGRKLSVRHLLFRSRAHRSPRSTKKEFWRRPTPIR